jgi:GNAT superfamily N-acetyltransferase
MVRIRPASPADTVALAQLRWDFRSTRGHTIESAAEFVERCAAWMADALTKPEWRCYVADADGNGASPAVIVGHLWIELVRKIPNPAAERERHAYITNVYVRPEHRGAGVASRLIEAALTWCREEEVDTAFLWPSEKSRPLYARHGFAVTGEILSRALF